VLLESGTIRPDQAAVVLNECIEDMRLIFDASASDDGNLETTLADFRYRMNFRLAPSGLRPDWRIDLAGMPRLSTHALLQLMRILQEAVNNALRHAGATRLEILARWTAEQATLEMSVRDDGTGIYAGHSAARGRGLPNMYRRAESIGAQLQISDAAPGTMVKIVLKIAQ
jgi:signal transduction histidine kinase